MMTANVPRVHRVAFCALLVACAVASAAASAPVPLYRLFEAEVTNTKTTAENKFFDVWLNTTFTSPSGTHTSFWGFYDGGATWRLRYMPNEEGMWSYTYTFSDASMAGHGEFECVMEGASPGVLQVYKENPHWFAYNGVTPVFIKSFYNKAGGFTRQDPTWAAENFYQKLVDRGYNHHMSSGFLPVLPLTALWDGQPMLDGPPAINHTIYTNATSPATSMQLDVWESLEGHIGFLNDHDILVDFFQGFSAQGPGGGDLQFVRLSQKMKEWWVAYVVARLAPFANLGNYVYSWETQGDGDDLLLAKLLHAMDPFDHLVTYEDANPIDGGKYDNPEWDMASVETYGGLAGHHNMSLRAYRGKPVYFCEPHLLWRSYWMAPENTLVSAAWAVTTAAASFTWNDMGEHFQTGPYNSTQAFSTYPSATKSIDILADIMANETVFHRLVPADALLGPDRASLTFCLAENGQQYLIYSDDGEAFQLDTTTSTNTPTVYSLSWFDAVEGTRREGATVTEGVVNLTPPSTTTHWVGYLKASR